MSFSSTPPSSRGEDYDVLATAVAQPSPRGAGHRRTRRAADIANPPRGVHRDREFTYSPRHGPAFGAFAQATRARDAEEGRKARAHTLAGGRAVLGDSARRREARAVARRRATGAAPLEPMHSSPSGWRPRNLPPIEARLAEASAGRSPYSSPRKIHPGGGSGSGGGRHGTAAGIEARDERAAAAAAGGATGGAQQQRRSRERVRGGHGQSPSRTVVPVRRRTYIERQNSGEHGAHRSPGRTDAGSRRSADARFGRGARGAGSSSSTAPAAVSVSPATNERSADPWNARPTAHRAAGQYPPAGAEFEADFDAGEEDGAGEFPDSGVPGSGRASGVVQPPAGSIAAIAVRPFVSLSPGELSLSNGDVLYVTERRYHGEWCGVNAATGDTGSFPASHVEAVGGAVLARALGALGLPVSHEDAWFGGGAGGGARWGASGTLSGPGAVAAPQDGGTAGASSSPVTAIRPSSPTAGTPGFVPGSSSSGQSPSAPAAAAAAANDVMPGTGTGTGTGAGTGTAGIGHRNGGGAGERENLVDGGGDTSQDALSHSPSSSLHGSINLGRQQTLVGEGIIASRLGAWKSHAERKEAKAKHRIDELSDPFSKLILSRTEPDADVESIDARINELHQVDRTVLIATMGDLGDLTTRLGVHHVLKLVMKMRRILGTAIGQFEDVQLVKTDDRKSFIACPSVGVATVIALLSLELVERYNETTDNIDNHLQLQFGVDWTGSVLMIPDDYYGDAVNVCSKLGEDSAGPGEIYVSARAYEALRVEIEDPNHPRNSVWRHVTFEPNSVIQSKVLLHYLELRKNPGSPSMRALIGFRRNVPLPRQLQRPSDFVQLVLSKFEPGANEVAIQTEIERRYMVNKAMLVLDLSGFTTIVRRYGILHFLAMIYKNRQMLIPVFKSFGGEVIKFEADNIFVLYDDAVSAVEGALTAQEHLDVYNRVGTDDPRPKDEAIRASIGIAAGPFLFVEEDEDVFGQVVDEAFIMGEDLADPGVVMVTEGVKDELIASGKPYNYEIQEEEEITGWLVTRK